MYNCASRNIPFPRRQIFITDVLFVRGFHKRRTIAYAREKIAWSVKDGIGLKFSFAIAVPHLSGELDTMAAFPSEAERLQRAMVDRRTAELGPDHLLTLKGVLKLAQTLKRSTDSETLNEAKVLLQRCINGFEETEVSSFHSIPTYMSSQDDS